MSDSAQPVFARESRRRIGALGLMARRGASVGLGIAFLLGAVLLLGACSQQAAPELAELYNRNTRYHDETRNPVVVIPGILGSRLIEPETQRIVWGAFGGGAANPKQPDGARLIALPMLEGAPLADLVDEVVPDGVLERMQVKIAGLPLQLKAYFEILLTLGAGGYRDQTFRAEGIDYGDDHFTCFQFDYDWRRDNVENAARLARFLEEKAAYVQAERIKRWGRSDPVRFDVIAHSMGGLLLRYYLRYGEADLPADGLPEVTWAGTAHVDRAVLVAPPNAGSVDALVELVDGRKFGPLTPLYQAAVIGTFPSLYQLLPRPRHGVLTERGAGAEPLDFFDPTLWEERGWGLADPRQEVVLEMILPGVPSAERRAVALDHLTKSLDRARRFHAALDHPATLPAGLSLYLVAGDAIPTALRLDDRTGAMEVVAEASGDGTVLRSSALMDERLDGDWQPELRSPVDWTHVTFLSNDHLGLTKDPSFTNNVLYLLLEAPRE